MTCPYCKKNIEMPLHFCPYCGVSISGKESLQLDTIKLTYMRGDLSGFTSMSETMIAEDVMAFLNEVFDIFTNIISSYKGTVYQVIGDEIVSVYGFPKGSGFAPHMAIMAAEDMLKKLSELNKKEYLKNPVGLKIGIAQEVTTLFKFQAGLRNAVLVTEGFMKSQLLQKNASENTVLVCEHMHDSTKAFFSYTEIGEFMQDALTVKAFEYKMKT